jgi:hypothetical protein
MNVNTTTSKFNEQLEEFLKFVAKICPIDNAEMQDIRSDIVSYSGLINAAIKLNKYIFIDKYIQYVLIHEDAINARDENFFLNMNYEKTYNNSSDVSILEVMRFKAIWHKLTPKMKTQLFDSIIILTYWARQYFNIKFVK